MMVPSDSAIELIKKCEGCKLEAYQDTAGYWTIGYGSTEDVTPGMKITQQEAESRLMVHLEDIAALMSRYIQVTLTQNQFDALCSFTYNEGIGNFKNSTLLKCVNAGLFPQAAAEFRRWDKAGGKELPGLIERRKLEEELFLT